MNPLFVSPYLTILCDKTGRPRGVQDHTGKRDTIWLEDSMLEQKSGTPRYVDFRSASDGGKGSASNDGLSPETPLLTMSAAITAAQNYDSIGFVGRCTESGLTLNKVGVHIYGMGQHYGTQCIWNPSSDAIAITLQAKGCIFSNFKAEAGETKAFIKAHRTSGAVNPADLWLVNIEGNTGKYLLDASDIDNVCVINVFAHDMDTPIRCVNGDPKRWMLAGCRFFNNDNHVVARLNDSEVVGCRFQAQGGSKTATVKLDLRNGTTGRNLVHQCFVGGTFSNAGGYYAGSNDEWVNNWNVGGLRHGNPA
jgi:hypothetical protein